MPSWDIRDLYRRLTPDEGHHFALLPLLAALRWVWVFYNQLQKDQAFSRAAAMAYQTLVALVPLLLLVFGILQVSGFLQKDRQALEALIFDTFIADIPEVRTFVMEGIGEMDLTALGIVGIASLVVFAGRLYLTVEYDYNYIFGTRVRRNWLYRLLNFQFAVTFIPVALTLGFVGSMDVAEGYGLTAVVRALAEPVVTFGVLLAALKLFPTVKVRWGPALLGAGVSTIGLWFARYGFKLYLLWFKTDDPLTIVYGTVGLVPVFLLWLYLVWVIVLLGVEIAYVAQNFHSLWEIERVNLDRRDRTVAGPRLHTALDLLAWTAWAFDNGRCPVDADALAKRLGLVRRDIAPVLDALTRMGFLVESGEGWTLSRPAKSILLADVVVAWGRQASQDRSGELPQTRSEAEINQALVRSLPPTLADAVDRWVRPEVEGPDAGGLREVGT
jgi:membrane protein